MGDKPPAPPRKPGQVKVMRALYKYAAQHTDELTFDEGDVLYVMDVAVSDPNWLKARCGDRIGLVPSNYVTENVELIETPLHDAARRGNLKFLLECISNGVSVNGLDKAGNTPLYWACHAGHISCIVPLLEAHNIDLDVQNKMGDTALHAASWKGRTEAVTLLLSKEANFSLTNLEGKTALELARDPQVIDLIMKHQDTAMTSDYNCEDYFGNDEDDDV